MSLSRVWIKICANTSLEDALLAAEAGADAVGFVFAPSSRRVTAAQIAAIAPHLPGNVEKIGVFVDASLDEIYSTVRACGLTGVQLHSVTGPELPAKLRARLGPRCASCAWCILEPKPRSTRPRWHRTRISTHCWWIRAQRRPLAALARSLIGRRREGRSSVKLEGSGWWPPAACIRPMWPRPSPCCVPGVWMWLLASKSHRARRIPPRCGRSWPTPEQEHAEASMLQIPRLAGLAPREIA